MPPDAADTEILDLHPPAEDLVAEVLAGLEADQPHLPAKVLYDDEGSRLFEQICELDEYYPTRTEVSILEQIRPELAEILGGDLVVVEYGSGSTRKVRLLMEGLDVATYVPIDISRWYLEEAAKELGGTHPGLAVRPILADFGQEIDLPDDLVDEPHVGFFPGGTIGNLAVPDAEALLRRIAHTMGPGGRLLLGFDFRKHPLKLHAAYNDRQGVTAAFNKNVLVRLNRELGADFDLDRWHHYAPYVPATGRIEMHLMADSEQAVTLGGKTFAFERGDTIRTEMSHKYTPDRIARLAAAGGMGVEATWTDEHRLFCVALLRA